MNTQIKPVKYYKLGGFVLIVSMLLTACQSATTQAPVPTKPPVPTATSVPPTVTVPAPTATEVMVTPSVTVSDQEIMGGMVTVADVFSSGPGFMVIHAQVDGKPGPVLGYTPVMDGENQNVAVMIDLSKATETLYAMLHTDAGMVGTYEFPGEDKPVMVGEQMVNLPFKVTGGLPTPETVGVVVSGDEVEIKIVDYSYSPAKLTIAAGTTVKWENEDGVGHTVTADNGEFDSGTMSKGDAFEFTFTKPGTYAYYCKPHGGPGGQGMSAEITVK